MKELKGTKTEKNLQEAFAGESMARNKYTYFASKARKDGYQQIAAIFEETAGNDFVLQQLWLRVCFQFRRCRQHQIKVIATKVVYGNDMFLI